MEIDEISDLSQICRLCLNTPTILIPFESRTPRTASSKTIPELIKFCLDINCSTRDGGIFPKNICVTCFEKLQIAFELKKNAQESDKYLKQILLNSDEIDEQTITPYEPVPYPFQSSQEDDLLQPLEDYYEPYDTHNVSDQSLRKGQRCGEFSCSVCAKTFKYVKSYNNHLKTHKSFRNDSSDVVPYKESSPEQEEENSDSSGDEEDPEYTDQGEGTGDHVCPSCAKAFKYTKPYLKHLKIHKLEDKRSVKKRLSRGQTNSAGPSSTQAPYDSISPYESPAPFMPSPSRESSPDISMTMVSSEFLNNLSEPPAKRPRKQKLPSRSLSLEPSPVIELEKKSRGRPRKLRIEGAEGDNSNNGTLQRDSASESNQGPTENKRSRGRPRKFKIEGAEEDNSNNGTLQRDSSPESKQGPTETKGRPRGRPRKSSNSNHDSNPELALFSEVDVSKMLKMKPMTFTADDSLSAPSENSHVNRSRSPSVEVVQEFDIFGSVVTSHDVLSGNPKATSGNFTCVIPGCSKKFHLKANLRKHQREVHRTTN